MNECLCPICGNLMLDHSSRMWTGMRNQTLRYKQQCVQRDHYFELSGFTEEEFESNRIKYGILYLENKGEA
jgi:hypothetical protein